MLPGSAPGSDSDSGSDSPSPGRTRSEPLLPHGEGCARPGLGKSARDTPRPQLLPATPRSRQVPDPSGTPRRPRSAALRGSGAQPGRVGPCCSAWPRSAAAPRPPPGPSAPALLTWGPAAASPPTGDLRLRGLRRAPFPLPDPAADKCPRSAHLSSPHLTPPPGPPGPREPRRSPRRRTAPARRHPPPRRAPRPEQTPGNAYRSS